MRTVTVDNCLGCPFGWTDEQNVECEHPDVDWELGCYFPVSLKIPDFCPLKGEAVTIELEKLEIKYSESANARPRDLQLQDFKDL